MHYPLIVSFKAISGCVGTKVHISQICSYIQLVTLLTINKTTCFHNIVPYNIQALNRTEIQNGIYLADVCYLEISTTQDFICTSAATGSLLASRSSPLSQPPLMLTSHDNSDLQTFRLQELKSTITC